MPRRTTSPGAAASADPHDFPADSRSEVRALLAETQAISARLAALNEVAVAVQASMDLDSALAAMAREARWLLDFQYCSVAERIDGGFLERVLKSPEAGAAPPRPLPLTSELIGRAMRVEHALLLRSAAEIGDAAPGMQSGLIVPLRAQGQVIGTLSFFADRPDCYTLDDLRITSALAAQTAMAVLNTRLFREIDAARDLLHTTLESIENGVAVLDEAGRIRLVNSAARRLLQLGDGELAGRRLLWLVARARAGARALIGRQALRRAVAVSEQGDTGGFELSDGRHLEWARAPLRDGAGGGSVVTLRDISDRVALEQLRDDMIGMLVHDLRTPLSALIMSLDLLRLAREQPDMGDDRDLIQHAGESAQHLLHQVNMLLDMRKLEAGRLALALDAHTAGDLLRTAARRLAALAQHARVRIDIDAPADLPFVSGDAALLERVLENMLGNAIAYSPRGGAVRLEARLAGAMVELRVIDAGPGVPPALRDAIFEKYGQAHREGQRRGTGLGLAFCKIAVEAHGGQVGLRGNPDGGSIFWLTVPANSAPA